MNNPYRKRSVRKADDKKVKFQKTHVMDKDLMERIGWSDGDVASFLSTYSNFEEDEDQKQQHKKPKSRVEKVIKVEKPDMKMENSNKVAATAAAAAAKKHNDRTVIEDV